MHITLNLSETKKENKHEFVVISDVPTEHKHHSILRHNLIWKILSYYNNNHSTAL